MKKEYIKKQLEERIKELKRKIDYEYESIQIRMEAREKLERLEQLFNDLFETP